MDVFEKTRELGEAIQGSGEYLRYVKAQGAITLSKAASALLEEYEENRRRLSDEVRAGDVGAERLEKIREEISGYTKKLKENAVVSEFLEAQKDFTQMVSGINGIISTYISGGDCGSGCDSCSGCK